MKNNRERNLSSWRNLRQLVLAVLILSVAEGVATLSYADFRKTPVSPGLAEPKALRENEVTSSAQEEVGKTFGSAQHVEPKPGRAATSKNVRSSNTDRASFIPLFIHSSHPTQQGFARIVNHSKVAGEVDIVGYDDAGRTSGTIVLTLPPLGVRQFNSYDFENGNPAKVSGAGGRPSSGDWYLLLESNLDIEALAYVRTSDGFLTSVNELSPAAASADYYVATFNPGSNYRQRSRLRLINASADRVEVTITGVDDDGKRGASMVTGVIEPRAARTLTAEELENGPVGFSGAFGDGSGKWRLIVEASDPIFVMSLLEDPRGYLTDLSTSIVPLEDIDSIVAALKVPEDIPDARALQDFAISIPSSCKREIEVCVRDHQCEDGDEGRVSVNGNVVFSGELFNPWHCEVVRVNAGTNSIEYFAINGTGFKGACDHSDINTGELRVRGPGGDGQTQSWRHRGGLGSRANLQIDISSGSGNCAFDGEPPPAADDHSDSISGATPLPLNGAVAGRVEEGEDLDVFRVEVNRSGTLTIHTTGSLDTVGALLDSAGSLLQENDDVGGGDRNFRIQRSVSAGTFYARVASYGTGVGDYRVHADFEAGTGGGGQDLWAALSISNAPASCVQRAFGLAWDGSTRAEVETAAIQGCTEGLTGEPGWSCREADGGHLFTWANGCGAYAEGDDCGGGVGTNTTSAGAEQTALDHCREVTNNCSIRGSKCTSNIR